jgi:nuclear RNA export factor
MNNCQFSGHLLRIEMSTQENPEINFGIRWNLTEIQKGIVLEYLNSVYDKDRKLLNLSSLSENAGLRASGLVDSTNNLTGLFPAIMYVIEGTLKTEQERTNMVESIRLAHNQLRDVYTVARLAQIFPNLLNLDLSYNDFSDLRSLSSWRLKFRGLQNLQISRNPIELIASDEDYIQELLRWFPSLQVLNSHQVRTPEQVAAALEEANANSRSAHISPIPINGSDFRDTTRKTGENFVLEFFARYDNDWEGIVREFYDDQSVHSISINMTAPYLEYQPSQPQSWDIYRNHSRNLTDISNRNHGRTSHYHRGLNSILNLWALLPPTRHVDVRDPLRYRVECHTFQGLPDNEGQMSGAPGLILTVHGDFVELHSDGSDKDLRGFSRTFVLGPGGSADSPVRVVSDMLMLRTWCPLPNQTTKDVDTLETGKVSKMAQLASIVERFSQETGLLSSWAELCLTRNDWNWHNSLQNFNGMKVSSDILIFCRIRTN